MSGSRQRAIGASAAATGGEPMERVIEHERGLALPSIRELWLNRELIYLLARRDVIARYKQTLAGVAWVILQPLLLAIVFSVFLGGFAEIPSGADVPYPVFAVAGMTFWLFFAAILTRVADSLVSGRVLVEKVYFPRIILPLTAALLPLVDIWLALVVVALAMAVYGVVPAVTVVLLPLAILLLFVLALGAGLWFAALNARYRDFSFIVPFLVLLGLFLTPIIYPFALVPENLVPIYSLNPVVGVLELTRWMLFPGAEFPGLPFYYALVAAPALLISGAAFFVQQERDIADIL